MRNNIRATLLSKLIDRPRPISGKAFRNAKSALFPGIESFRQFLRSEREDEQKIAAQDILIALTHEKRFAPPWALISNLLDFEERQAGTEVPGRNEYVGQDHVVHLVNLYLTGLYLFSYHRGIHNQCRTRLRSMRRAVQKDLMPSDAANWVGDLNDYELFADVWTYFVLLHDIGYPLEVVLPKDRRTTNRLHPNLEPFSRLSELVLDDVSTRALSHLVTLDFLLTEESATELHNHIPHGLQLLWVGGDNEDLEGDPILDTVNQYAKVPDARAEGLLGRLGNALHFSGVDDPFSLRLIFSAFPSVTVCAVLEQEDSGAPIGLVVRHEERLTTFSIGDAKLPSRISQADPDQIRDDAFIRAAAPHGTEWRYFFLDARPALETVLGEIFGPSSVQSYRDLAVGLRLDLPVQSRLVFGGGASKEIARSVFGILARSAREATTAKPLLAFSRSMEAIRASFSTVTDRFSTLAGDAVEEVVRKAQGNHELDVFERLSESNADKRRVWLQSFFSESAGAFSDSLMKKITPAIDREFNRVRAADIASRDLKSHIISGAKELSEDRVSSLDLGVPFDFRSPVPSSTEPIYDRIDEILEGIGAPTSRVLFSTYSPPRSPAAQGIGRCLDHGLVSLTVGTACATLYSQFQSLIQENAGKPGVDVNVRLLRIAMALGVREHDELLTYELQHVIPISASIVSIHNLYPSALPEGNRQYRTSIRVDPLAFTALLSDALQVWDRPKRANHVTRRVDAAISGQDLDITIDDNVIRLIAGKRIEIADALKIYRARFDDYLAGAAEMIQIRLIT